MENINVNEDSDEVENETFVLYAPQPLTPHNQLFLTSVWVLIRNNDNSENLRVAWPL